MTSEAGFGVAVRRTEPEPLRFRVIAWSLTGITLAIFIVGFESGQVREQLSWELLAWMALGTLVNLAPIQVGPLLIDMDFPIFLAAGFIFGPILAGLMIFVSAVDRREIRRGISVPHALANRAQVALSVMAGASLFRAVGDGIGNWPWVLVPAFLAVTADAGVNYSLVTLLSAWRTSDSPLNVWHRLSIGDRRDFFVGYVGYGFAGLLLAELYVGIGPWSLLAFSLPIYLAREAFVRTQRLEEAGRALRVGRQALAESTERAAEERQDERLNIAAALHDDVLQSLHYLTLFAHVVREDLRTGRLLQLDDDVPALVEAAQETAILARAVIKDLRDSPLGRSGLVPALWMLISELRESRGARIEANIESVESRPATQLLLYQVAREALQNAVEHGRASTVALSLVRKGERWELVVSDDGCGFDSGLVDRTSHFGLQLMQERVRAAEGEFSIQSAPEEGTRIVASFPIESRGVSPA